MEVNTNEYTHYSASAQDRLDVFSRQYRNLPPCVFIEQGKDNVVLSTQEQVDWLIESLQALRVNLRER